MRKHQRPSNVEERPAKTAHRGGGGRRRQCAASKAVSAGAPPAPPPSLANVLSLDPVASLLLSTDSVRSLPLVCRNLASLLAALGQRAAGGPGLALWG